MVVEPAGARTLSRMETISVAAGNSGVKTVTNVAFWSQSIVIHLSRRNKFFLPIPTNAQACMVSGLLSVSVEIH